MALGRRALRDRKPKAQKPEAAKRSKAAREKARLEAIIDQFDVDRRVNKAKLRGNPKIIDPKMLPLRRRLAKSKKPIRT